MKRNFRTLVERGAAAVAIGASLAFSAFAQSGRSPTPPAAAEVSASPEAQRHIEAAIKAAGEDFKVTEQLQCGAGAVPGPGGLLSDNSVVPVTRVFDNLYYLGLVSVGAFAVVTSDGIIMIDSLNNADDAKRAIVEGLRSAGLDPTKIKMVIVTHAHGDHYGGATYLKQQFGAPIVMSDADWKAMAGLAMRPGGPVAPQPAKDQIGRDGQQITLGDTTLTLIETPGHTPGTLSIVIPVKDHGQPHVAVLWGGTGIPRATADQQRYVESVDKLLAATAKMNIDAEISNHAFVDDSLRRMESLRSGKSGQPNPFVIGNEAFKRYMTVIGECAKAKLADSLAKTS